MPPRIVPLLFAVLILTGAGQLTGRVLDVIDGDKLTIQVDSRAIGVRLADIDAPQLQQQFGPAARQSLAELCMGALASFIDEGRRDLDGRIVARVDCAGRDAAVEQLRRGMAWVYDRFVGDQSLYSVQANAREKRLGLWAEPAPVPPWQWRRGAMAPL